LLEKLYLLILIVTANGTPILLDDLMGRRWAWPLDGSLRFSDGRRLVGSSDTVRGLVGALVLTTAVAVLLGLPVQTGLLVGFFAMVGDVLSSFIKRRMALKSGDKAIGLDQVPESLLPLLAVMDAHGLDWLDVALLVLTFTLFSLAVSRILFRLKLRKRPH
jgi:CDP-2,3-bis-(O-geranylgeranyl)-sn-glycerol synthase